ncbi:MAG: hypothetical protein MI975_28400 [Cytophagales bacterium]|nr:hypothetical protein [Cytophagales bacterium]
MAVNIKWGHLLVLIFGGMIVITAIDFIRIINYAVYPMKPTERISLNQDRIYRELKDGKTDIDWSELDGTLEFISKEYDCSDFRFVNLIRILYEFEDRIPEAYLDRIKRTLYNFRYWWDEPGENSMCYWSENHQILFASAEYLVGQKYPEAVFGKSGLTGSQHMAKARNRLLDWLEMRWNYGFIEFYSEVYYKEDIGAMINLIDYAGDKEIVEKTKIILDVMFYDLAAQNIKTMYSSVSGRAYEGNRKGGKGKTLGGVTGYFWGSGDRIRSGMTHGLMYTDNYTVPPVLIDIATDTSNVIIKQSNGLNLIELADEGYFGTDNRSMMMQWGMEAFTNPIIVRNSLSHIRNCDLFSNEFIKDFRYIDFSLLKWFGLEPALVNYVNPPSNGVAIQRGNTYTYKTKDYSIYTVQKYHPGTFGDQQHVSGMNISNVTSIFHTHPAIEKDVARQSPNYWVGYGHLPHAVQDGRVSLAIYNIPEKKGLMEADLLDYTHAYFPAEMFDTTVVESNFAFGKSGETYCVFVTKNELNFRSSTVDDLIQQGKKTFWITEAGSKSEDGSFKQFYTRIKSNEFTFFQDDLILRYVSGGKTYELKFAEDFKINGVPVDTDYPRYDSPYVRAEMKDKTITYSFNGKSLRLDFENSVREF